MSYNISKWKTKRIENLTMPLEELLKEEWHVKNILKPNDQHQVWLVGLGEGGEIKGVFKNETVFIDSIEIYGECSGSCFEEIILPALKQSTGHLEAVLVWERGDSITRLTVDNGTVSNEPIEL